MPKNGLRWAKDVEPRESVFQRVAWMPVFSLASRLKIKVMNCLFKILTIVAVAGLVVGLSDIGNGMFSGMARALGSVFFILAFITRTIQKAEQASA